MRPAFAEQPVGSVHIAVHGGENHDRVFLRHLGQQPADRPVGRLEMGVIPGQLAAGLHLHVRAQRHVGWQHDRARIAGPPTRGLSRIQSGDRRIIRRMRRFEAHHAKPRPGMIFDTGHRRPDCRRAFGGLLLSGIRYPLSALADPCSRARTHHLGLIAREFHRLRQPRSMQPRIVDQETALKSLPELKTAAPCRRHHDPGVGPADQLRPGIALIKVPLAEKRRRVPARVQPVRDGARLRRKRIMVIAHAVLRRPHSGEQGRAGKRAEGMRRHGLGVVDRPGRQRIQVRRARIGVAGITRRQTAPLGGDDPQDVGRGRGHGVAARLGANPRRFKRDFMLLAAGSGCRQHQPASRPLKKGGRIYPLCNVNY